MAEGKLANHLNIEANRAAAKAALVLQNQKVSDF